VIVSDVSEQNSCGHAISGEWCDRSQPRRQKRRGCPVHPAVRPWPC